MRRLLTPLLGSLTSLALALMLGAGLLWLLSTAGPEQQPVVLALTALGCLGIGYLVGRAIFRPGRRRPPVPLTVDAMALPAAGLGRTWARGFAAGFWALVALGVGATLLYDLGVRLPLFSPLFLRSTRTALLALGITLCAAIPLATARGMLAGETGLPRWTPVSVAIAACATGWSMVLASGLLVILLQSLSAGNMLADLLATAALPVAAMGTPLLTRSRWPSLASAWTIPLALAALPAAWLLRVSVDGWISIMGPMFSVFWLIPAGLLWGGSLGALLALAAARRRAGRAPGSAALPRRVALMTLAALTAGLLLLALIPLGGWLISTPAPGSPAPPPAGALLPDVAQPGALTLPGPILLEPAAGVSLAGPVWTFHWSPPSGGPPPGAGPGPLYQFALWAPGASAPITQFPTPTPQARVQIAPEAIQRHPGAWTWRVRVVQPGQGAGQWSEARPFIPLQQ